VSLMRWDPLREMMSLREAMNRLFEDSFGRSPEGARWEAGGAFPVPIDMYETEDQVILSAALPGIKPEDVDIRITGNTLTIRGEAKSEEESQQGNVYVQERRYGAFRRSITLPPNIDSEQVEATFEDGVLKLTMPKSAETKPKQIEVKAGTS
jgi:HSP20 family protein